MPTDTHPQPLTTLSYRVFSVTRTTLELALIVTAVCWYLLLYAAQTVAKVKQAFSPHTTPPPTAC